MRSHPGVAIGGAISIALLFAAPYAPFASAALHLRYVIPDLLIFALLAWMWRGDAMRRAGLVVPLREALFALLILGLGLGGMALLEPWWTETLGVRVSGRRPFFSASQVFHQELVLRGLLLGVLVRRVSSQLLLAVAAAAFFAVLHPLYFWWRFDLVVPITTTFSLFLFGFATNRLYFRTGHIAYPFALHAAWNLSRFGAEYRLVSSHTRISEAQSFALIEGSWLALATSALLVALVSGTDRWARAHALEAARALLRVQ